ncbi:sensory neuron membrane protein 2-like [Anthonomus grandis grandis]|uniref:sensory neuron membrane protein 2-like n=1 Tax=Anthonomus grandis grandis TaxID=2921223 RepID=UPI0021662726|nr:sensory neuron membrane protein 2-like [Anthonomus grandis grandis]
MYVFTIENPEGVYRKEHVKIKEQGPYIYKLIEEVKNDKKFKTFHFDSEASLPLTEKDQIFPINTLLLNFLYQIEPMLQQGTESDSMDRAFMINEGVKKAFHENANIAFNSTVKNLFFDGIVFCENRTYHAANRICKILEPSVRKSDSFQIDPSGAISFRLFNRIEVSKINEKPKPRKVWKENEYKCNEIRGIVDGMFPLHVDRAKIYEYYISSICRPIKFIYFNKKYIETMPGYTFKASQENFDSSFPENECFCSRRNATKSFVDSKGCMPKGAIDLSPCKNALLLLSYPHFLYAEDSYFYKIEGLSPDPEHHESEITVEPISGIPFEVSMRIQLSTVLHPVKHITVLKNVDEVIVPMFWIEVGFTLPESDVHMLRYLVYETINLVYYISIVGCVLTFLGFVICIILLILRRKYRGRKYK